MERLTEYDKVRGCYVIKPDAPQGQHIQRLGMYEDRDEAKMVLYESDGDFDGKPVYDMARCPGCDCPFENGDDSWESNFCPSCGQRWKWEVDG